MKFLSKTSIYGIRAALYVAAKNSDKRYVPIREISSELGISFHFLTKILQTLTQHNIMISYRGPNGGVSLARPATDITLMELVKAIEPDDCFDCCILGLSGCGEETPCPLHEQWGETRGRVKSMFEDTNLAELGRKIQDGGLRLAM